MSGRGGRNASNNRVCAFYLEGRCKFGDSCKFEHPRSLPGEGRKTSSTPSPAIKNRVADNTKTLPYNLDKESVLIDLQHEKPQWPFSAYGPGKHAPRQMLEGLPFEQSPEERRLGFYQARDAGQAEAFIQDEMRTLALMEERVKFMCDNADEALEYIANGEHEHPNRLDMCFSNSGSIYDAAPAATATGWPAQPAQPMQTSSFGQPSVPTNSMTTPQLTQPGFGQASTFGAPSATAQSSFGQPSTFGAPSSAPSSTFGQPSTFGAPSSAPVSGFGQPSAFAAASSTPSSGFGLPSALGSAVHTNGMSPFAQAGTVGPQQTSFGQPSAPQSTFASPFASLNHAAQQAPNGHGHPFAAPIAPAHAASPTPDAMDHTTTSENEGSASVTPDVNRYMTYDGRGRVQRFKNQAVVYVDEVPHAVRPDGKKERIWFPNGIPVPNPCTEVTAEIYAVAGTALEQIYHAVASTGTFQGGLIPEIPPKRDWIRFDI